MALDIKPGQWVTVKVKSQPRAAARVKTMLRLFERDSTVQKERRRVSSSRFVKPSRRGGRIWMNRPARLQLVKTTAGATYKLFASVDVLQDLASIERYIEVKPAK